MRSIHAGFELTHFEVKHIIKYCCQAKALPIPHELSQINHGFGLKLPRTRYGFFKEPKAFDPRRESKNSSAHMVKS